MLEKLSKDQSDRIADFCNDVAKGLFLSVAVGQAFVSSIPFDTKLQASLLGAGGAIMFLWFAILFSRRPNNTDTVNAHYE